MGERADILIVGGGVIGASVAWALACRGVSGIVVVDLDLAGVYASSELIESGRFDQCDLSALTRERFEDRSRWVQEELHI